MDICSRCLGDIWIPHQAAFSQDCIPLLSSLPTALTFAALAALSLRHVWKSRPVWMRNFAAEDFDDDQRVLQESAPSWAMLSPHICSRPRFSTKWFMCFVSLVGAGLSLGLFLHHHVVVFMASLVPMIITAAWAASLPHNYSLPVSLLVIQAGLFAIQLAILLGMPVDYQTRNLVVSWLLNMLPSFCLLVHLLQVPLRPQWILAYGIAAPFEPPSNEKRSPEDNLTMWQWMSVRWMNPLISLGNMRQLNSDDVWKLPLEFQHARLHAYFANLEGSIVVRLLKANGSDLAITTFLAILETGLSFSAVVFLRLLLGALGAEPNVSPSDSSIYGGNIRAAIVYAILILIANVACAQSELFSLWFCRRAYERSRGEMITMIYEKTLNRKAFTFPGNKADDGDRKAADADQKQKEDQNAPASTGKILNLMRNDVYEISQRLWEFPEIITFPLNLIISTTLIWKLLGPSSLVGILVLIAAQSFNALLLKTIYSWEHIRRGVSDTKLQLVSQFIESLRHLRWYDWQDSWLAQILEVREKELRFRVWNGLLMKLITMTNRAAAYTFPVVAFWAYTVVGGNKLTVDLAFPALSLFTILQSSLRQLPDLITTMLNAAVAMGRIERFMAEPDREIIGGSIHTQIDINKPAVLEIKDSWFSWPGSAVNVLEDVNVSCSSGLTAVYGRVGSGKSALMHAFLGELDRHVGSVSVPNEMMAYCAQIPWLQSMSIRDNILFCAPFDEKRYRLVLDACCLLPDLASFKAGDLSSIGENGIGLSGGQKARVALARAVYSKARILLLDDPIAALDHQTAESIMQKLFSTSNLMKSRTVVIATHRVDIVKPYATQELEIIDGKVVQHVSPPVSETEYPTSFIDSSSSTHEDSDDSAEEDRFKDAIPDKFIEEEHRTHGSVVSTVYWRYIKAGKLYWWLAIIVGFLTYRSVNVLYYYFLKIWGEGYKLSQNLHLHAFYHTSSINSQILNLPDVGSLLERYMNLPSPEDDVKPWLFWFAILSLIMVIAQVIPDLVLLALSYTAGRTIFRQAMHRISTSTFRFLDVTPVGRLMNRVTSDMSSVDGSVAANIFYCVWHGVTWTSAMLVIAMTAPAFLVLAIIMTVIFVLVFLSFLSCSQSLRRLEMVSLSPLMSNFGTLVEGLITVRAFHTQSHFRDANIKTTDAFQQMDHFYWSLQGWLQSRFDTMSAVATFSLTLAAILGSHGSGTVGFVLAAASNFVSTTHVLCRRYSQLQMEFVSVERVIELLDLDQEAQGDIKPGPEWPSPTDDVVFDNVTLRYAPHLDPSLQNISMRVPAGSTVAVTGRTGSGKSTMALALLATLAPELAAPYSDTEPETATSSLLDTTIAESEACQAPSTPGSIWIGDVDLSRVDKHILRQRISFVAQDPVLFPGTLRDNFDPANKYSDAECEAVLERVMRGSGSFSLTSPVDGGGKNMSQGQRQLIGLGRAVLRHSPIVILDEATASIDMETALYIQNVLREELQSSTVFTIAHRVEAVRDADFLVVMDKGRLAYAGPPLAQETTAAAAAAAVETE
ncbi:Canalicular multispecific organic anion transporter 1 [Ceratocystis fimbriata CBS 114723]|uniref:Canalicular multispecific organic anion transporter 1 n=1 Tax=Ceratocystis fimbriata CBS 114723 TaxID=1035309 RepID=A0A2C5X4N0_9PEZI|nr:Canalicular multispecific organic anion transporter 1 [Ceratocystis fimbriata CBS 114723]